MHLGSLAAAAASYLDARLHRGGWRLRLEDIDPERDRPQHSVTIIDQLAAHGLEWDGAVLYQSSRTADYRARALALRADGMAYACGCPRKRLAALGYRYDGRCRHRDLDFDPARALRLNTQAANRDNADLAFSDRIYGRVLPETDVDDFIIWRRGDLPAYQLAVVVDDADAGVTHVVRGADLLHETHRQLLLYALLQRSPPQYAHVPLVMAADGRKLSKQNGAAALDPSRPSDNLAQALQHLGLAVPSALKSAPLPELLAFGLEHFKLNPTLATVNTAGDPG